MKTVLCFVVLLLGLAPVVAQDSNFTITHPYIGCLYAGQGNETSETWLHGGSSRIGARFETEIGDGFLKVNAWNDNLDISQTRAHVFYENNLASWLNLKIGPSLSHPIAISHRPNPVSLWGHFEAGALAIMPGAGVGTNLAINTFTGNKITLGVFDAVQGKTHFPEYNADITQELGWLKIQASGFYSELSSGAAIALKDAKGNISLTYYRNSAGLESSLLWIDSQAWKSDLGAVYVNAINQYLDKKFQALEIGWLKNLVTNFAGTKIQLLTGVAYQIHDVQAIKFYFLIYSE